MRDFTRGRRKAWCRIDCYERQFHMASFFLHQPVITIDGSHVVDQSAKYEFCMFYHSEFVNAILRDWSLLLPGEGQRWRQGRAKELWLLR